MKKTINDASASELSLYAQTNYGLDVRHTLGKEKILAALRTAGFDGDEIETEEATETGAQVVRPVVQSLTPAKQSKGPRRWVELEIHEQEIPGGTEPQPVGVNGSLMYVPRGQRVEIPYEYYEVLKNARGVQYKAAPDEFTPIGEAREVPRLPMTVYRVDPEPEQVAA